MKTATRGHAARGREDMGVPDDMPEQAGGRGRQRGAHPRRAARSKQGNAKIRGGVWRDKRRYGEVRLSSDNVPEGARGAICIKRSRPTESRPDVIWVTYAFMRSGPG
ncbi:hypothetical protein GCM10010298_05070 [Streptomyces microflavus]|nr:hypothetical protein GCM10010298_05070 [Streptomyces microflavus]